MELEIILGSLTLFLSPRQLHVLLELAHGLASPNLEDMSNVAPRRYAEKPMASSDFTRIERELIHQTYPMQDFKTTVTRFINVFLHKYVCFFNITLCIIFYRTYDMLKDGLQDPWTSPITKMNFYR